MFLASLTVVVAFAQNPEPAQRFPVADVHPSAHSTSSAGSDVSGGLMHNGDYRLRRATMLDLVSRAYGVDANTVLGGPNWLELDRFDIQAKVPAGATAATVRPMLQSLLAERFGLVVHRDTKPVATWALTSGKHPLLKRANGSGDGRCVSSADGESIEVTCRNITMAAFVSNMGRMDGAWYYIADHLVVDHTGLDGAWDFDLKYSARWTAKVAGTEITSLFDAIDRTGLKLDPAMVLMPVLVVDRVNRVPTPNSTEAAQAFPPPPTEFEVAVVKPTDPAYNNSDFQVEDGGRVTIRGATLQSLIADSWDITREMIVDAPKFLDSARWDITAKVPKGAIDNAATDPDSLNMMLRTLLIDRFQLKAHYEERTLPAYVMTASKPKLKKADPDSRSGCREGPPTLRKVEPRSTNPVLGRLLTCTNVSMAWFADELQYLASGYVHSGVLDQTGLEGGWDFTLNFSKAAQFRGSLPEPGTNSVPDPSGALSAPEAMERQLGLRLELRKRPVRALVIDHIDETPTGN